MKLHDLPKCKLSESKQEKRQQQHLELGKRFEKSVLKMNFDRGDIFVVAERPAIGETFIPMARMYKDLPLGAVNTVENAGSICFVSYYILMDYEEIQNSFPFEKWVREIVTKGYRAWKFANYEEIFTSSKIYLEEVKARFAEKVDLTCCEKAEDLTQLLGPVEGVGVNLFLIDNVILQISKRNYDIEDTRLTSVEGIIENLRENIYVPLRVNNAIYYNDQTRVGGRYVILYGIEDKIALVWDSSVGTVRIPFKTLMEAAIVDKGLIAVWNLR